MTPEFESKLLSMRPSEPRTVALAMATDVHALRAVSMAHQMGFINAILCGPESEINSVAMANDIDISAFEIIDCASDIDAATMAVSLVRSGRADILMKGLIHTADILRAVLNRDTGIRGDGILSHVSVMYSPSRQRTLFLTDIAMVMYPDLDKKVQLIKNAVSVARHMGVDTPRVATLCAVETFNPKMQATVDAQALYEMNMRGEISNCIISGPIAFDIAVSPDAAVAKKYTGPVQGNADILLFDNIEAGNNTIKSMVLFSDWIFGGVVIGARAPIVLNSRSDSDISKLFSLCCACTM
ncbi:MAG: bifunctional enoyl-CoA hydratase/phosphate acetyltransferase [Alphaproteobacteria bacterium]|nr:bifunctional enoyl-CoA hydratase/phosphate acetyltransferase [Alphaproteobacteria bacterium]